MDPRGRISWAVGSKMLRRKISPENGEWGRILLEGDGFTGTDTLSIRESLKTATTLKKKFPRGRFYKLFCIPGNFQTRSK